MDHDKENIHGRQGFNPDIFAHEQPTLYKKLCQKINRLLQVVSMKKVSSHVWKAGVAKGEVAHHSHGRDPLRGVETVILTKNMRFGLIQHSNNANSLARHQLVFQHWLIEPFLRIQLLFKRQQSSISI